MIYICGVTVRDVAITVIAIIMPHCRQVAAQDECNRRAVGIGCAGE